MSRAPAYPRHPRIPRLPGHILAFAALLPLASAALAGGDVAPVQVPLSTNQSQHGQRAVAVDMDGDGDADVLTAWSLTDEVTLDFNTTGDGTAWQRVRVGHDIVGTAAEPLDADCDGDLDIAAIELFARGTGFFTPGRLSWFERPTSVTTPDWIERVIDDTVVHFKYLDTGDIDRDGDTDLVICSNGSDGVNPGNLVAWYENRCGAPSGPRWQRYIVATGLDGAETVRIADVSGTASRDIVVMERSGDRARWFANDGDPRRESWSAYTIVQGGGGPFAGRFLDLGGSPAPDLVVSFSDAGAVRRYERPADPRTQPWTAHPVAESIAGARELFVADFTNDGLPDVATGSSDLSQFILIRNTGSGFVTEAFPYPGFTFADGADIDGDGDTDVLTTSYGESRTDWWRNGNTLLPPLTPGSGWVLY